MQQQFAKVGLLVVAFIAVGTIASLATAVVMLSGSDGGAGRSSVSQGALGAQLGPSTGLQEIASVRFRSSTIRGTDGLATLRLFNDQGGSSIETTARASGRGISDRGAYDIWLEPPANAQGAHPVLLGTGTGDNDDEWRTGRTRTQLPYEVTTLEGFNISIRLRSSDSNIGPQQVAATGPALLSTTVTKADISG